MKNQSYQIWLQYRQDSLQRQINLLQQTLYRLQMRLKALKESKRIDEMDTRITNYEFTIHYQESLIEQMQCIQQQNLQQLNRFGQGDKSHSIKID